MNNKKKTHRVDPFTAAQKCEAVLAIWSNQRKPGDICREMEIAWAVVGQWQKKAMEGMIEALSPRRKKEQGPKLNPKLAKLFQRQVKITETKTVRPILEERLREIQKTKSSPVKKT